MKKKSIYFITIVKRLDDEEGRIALRIFEKWKKWGWSDCGKNRITNMV